MRRLPRLLLPILILALTLRVIWALVQPVTPAAIDRLPDQREYLSIAQNLLHDHSLSFFDPRFKQTVYAYRLPGYPLFLAACDGSIRVARLAQSVIDVSTVLAVFLIARQLCQSVTAGLIAAALMAINPFYVFFAGLILSETLFAALMVWGVWFLVSRRFFLAVLLLAASCYVRPIGLLLVPALAAVSAVNSPRSKPYLLWDACRRAAVATLFTLACLFPWALRNHHLLGSWIWTTTNGGITLYDGFHPGATGNSDQRFITDQPQLLSINEVQRSEFFQREAKEWIGRNWREIPALSVRKIIRGWSPVPLSKDFGKPMYRLIGAGYNVPFDLLCLLGLFSARLTLRTKLLLVLPALIVTLGQILSVGSIRYRMPAEAPLAVVAAVGAMSLTRRRSDEGSNAKVEL